jgi:uncharacterized membrane protein YciS (DUF1049 family)
VIVWGSVLAGMLYVSDRWEIKALFSEMFSGLDALFSGLAFVGLICAIVYQKRELQLQKEELQLTRKALQRTASAQEKSEASLKQQSETMLLAARLSVMTSIIELKKTKQEINASMRNLGFNYTPGLSIDQVDAFIAELEGELASISRVLQYRENTSHAPRSE